MRYWVFADSPTASFRATRRQPWSVAIAFSLARSSAVLNNGPSCRCARSWRVPASGCGCLSGPVNQSKMSTTHANSAKTVQTVALLLLVAAAISALAGILSAVGYAQNQLPLFAGVALASVVTLILALFAWQSIGRIECELVSVSAQRWRNARRVSAIRRRFCVCSTSWRHSPTAI